MLKSKLCLLLLSSCVVVAFTLFQDVQKPLLTRPIVNSSTLKPKSTSQRSVALILKTPTLVYKIYFCVCSISVYFNQRLVCERYTNSNAHTTAKRTCIDSVFDKYLDVLLPSPPECTAVTMRIVLPKLLPNHKLLVQIFRRV